MNKEFLNTKLSYKVTGNDEFKRWEKGQIWYLVDKHLDSTDEYIYPKNHPLNNEKRKKNYNYQYHLMNIDSGRWDVLDQDEFDSFRLYVEFHIDNMLKGSIT